MTMSTQGTAGGSAGSSAGLPPGSVARYQIVLIEPAQQGAAARLEALLLDQVQALGVDPAAISVLHGEDANKRDPRGPVAAVYFGTDGSLPSWVDPVVAGLVNDGVPILPVVEDTNRFRELVPDRLTAFNGRAFDGDDKDLNAIACIVLENLDLLRRNRRIFISYRRVDSRGVAVQVYEALEAAGYEAFLDTHSIRGSDLFQDELWQRLSDVDLVVLLDSPNFLTSYWTAQELARVNALGIGMVQLLWPNQKLDPQAGLALPIQLTDTDFVGGTCTVHEADQLVDSTVRDIVSAVEGHRARSTGARHKALVGEVCSAAAKAGHSAQVHWRRCIVVTQDGGHRKVAVPVVGVPDAVRYHDVDRLIDTVDDLDSKDAVLVYNHAGIRERWLEHLEWLNGSGIRIKGVRVAELEKAFANGA